MPLPPSELHLAEMAGAAGFDPLLDSFVRIAESRPEGPACAITVVVGAMTVSGTVAAPDAFARSLDRTLDQALATVEDDASVAPDDRAEAREARLANRTVSYERLLGDDRAELDQVQRDIEDAVDGAIDWRLSDLPDDLARRYLASRHRRAFTLADATIETPSGHPVRRPHVRIVMAHVGAWWC
jgi:hypothetical protein